MDPPDLIARQRESQRCFYRALAAGSPGARLLELPGVQATLVPARPWFSIFNSVFYTDAGSLDESTHAALASAYARAGVKAWTVWVPPGDEPPPVLRERGHVLDSTPMLFAADIDALAPGAPGTALDLEPQPSWEMVCEVNDRAHGVLPEWSMATVFAAMDDPASHLHVARADGAAACALIAREHDGDCYFWFVATAPEMQRRGLASALMRHAVGEARERGCTTTSLESTRAGERTYENLGYLALGRYEMWELRGP